VGCITIIGKRRSLSIRRNFRGLKVLYLI
jgi:hypothetical protein